MTSMTDRKVARPFAILLLVFGFGLAACGDDASDEAGDAIEETGEAVQEAGEEAGDAVEEAGDEAGDAVEDATQQ